MHSIFSILKEINVINLAYMCSVLVLSKKKSWQQIMDGSFIEELFLSSVIFNIRLKLVGNMTCTWSEFQLNEVFTTVLLSYLKISASSREFFLQIFRAWFVMSRHIWRVITGINLNGHPLHTKRKNNCLNFWI